MDTHLLRQFQSEALQQCTYILMAADQIQQRISAESYDDAFWREIQNFVASTANVSKLLWGQKGKFAKERKPLRDSIKVADSSPLRPTTMRNHFEHIDERLDEWWAESSGHNYADRNVGSPAITEVFGAPLKKVELFRAYDPSTADVTFWGDTYNLKEIVDEVMRIYPLLQAEVAKPRW